MLFQYLQYRSHNDELMLLMACCDILLVNLFTTNIRAEGELKMATNRIERILPFRFDTITEDHHAYIRNSFDVNSPYHNKLYVSHNITLDDS